jgi:hypothetical protein
MESNSNFENKRGVMKMYLGEEGTEQFSVTTRVNGEQIGFQEIHDPFVRTTVKLRGWKHAWRALFGGLKIQVSVDASHGAQRAIMTLDPTRLQADTEEFLRNMAVSRAENTAMGAVGYAATDEFNRR